jgi:hypothetical protein
MLHVGEAPVPGNQKQQLALRKQQALRPAISRTQGAEQQAYGPGWLPHVEFACHAYLMEVASVT